MEGETYRALALTTRLSEEERQSEGGTLTVGDTVMPLPLSDGHVAELLRLAPPATCGVEDGSRGMVRVHDDALHTCRKLDDLYVPLASAALHARLRDSLDNHPDASASSLTFSRGALLLYSEGGHFATHTDRSRGDGHWGTAIVRVPTVTPHEGGDLWVVGHEPSKMGDFDVVLLPLGVPHRVETVTRGVRVVLRAPLFENHRTRA